MKFYNLKIKNRFTLEDYSFLINMYKSYPDLLFKHPKIFKVKFFRVLVYPIYLLANVYGMIRLSSSRDILLKAIYHGRSNKAFTIRDTNSQFHSIYFKQFNKCYEPDVTGALELFLAKDSVFVDIGSNWGHHSFYAALEKDCQVVAFEPNTSIAKDLERIREELKLSERFEINNCALSSTETNLKLQQYYFDSGVASINSSYSNSILFSNKSLHLLKKLCGIPPIESYVKVLTLDSFNLNKATLIKIDAEGVEFEILEGAINTIQSCKPVIIFEHHYKSKADLNKFVIFFDKINYKIYTIECNEKFDSEYDYGLIELNHKSLEINSQYNLIALHSTKYHNFEVN
jgi:FkbM family methyltransferase